MKQQYQTVKIQFGGGPVVTMGLNDGAIRPQREVGIGPELAARVSTQVVQGDPSGDDRHVAQLSESVSGGGEAQGIDHPSASTPQMLGRNSQSLAYQKPTQTPSL